MSLPVIPFRCLDYFKRIYFKWISKNIKTDTLKKSESLPSHICHYFRKNALSSNRKDWTTGQLNGNIHRLHLHHLRHRVPLFNSLKSSKLVTWPVIFPGIGEASWSSVASLDIYTYAIREFLIILYKNIIIMISCNNKRAYIHKILSCELFLRHPVS
jgi:hypothetical protein